MFLGDLLGCQDQEHIVGGTPAHYIFHLLPQEWKYQQFGEIGPIRPYLEITPPGDIGQSARLALQPTVADFVPIPGAKDMVLEPDDKLNKV